MSVLGDHSSFSTVPIGDEAKIIMGNSPPGDAYTESPIGIPLLNGPTEFTERSPSPTKWTEAGTRFANPGDVLFCVRGSTTGRMNVADQPYAIGRGIAAVRGEFESDTRFIHAAIESSLSTLLSLATGSTFPQITAKQLAGFEIPWPPENERQAIAEVLGALDDKIESNRRLEASAHKFLHTTWNELTRNAPRMPIADVAMQHKALVKPAEQPSEEFEQFSIPAFDKGEMPELSSGASMASSKILLPRGGAVLVSKLNPSTRRVWDARPDGARRAVCSPEFVALIPKDPRKRALLGAAALYDERFHEGILERVSGTTGSRQRIRPIDLMECGVPSLADEGVARLHAIADPILTLLNQLALEGQTLEGIRDTLLPRLISGKLRVQGFGELTETE